MNSLTLEFGCLSFTAVLRLREVVGENKHGPLVRYEVVSEPFLKAQCGVYLVTQDGVPVYCGKFTNTFAKLWLYRRKQNLYHSSCRIIADTILANHEMAVYAQTQDSLREQIGQPANVWVSSSSIEEKLISDLHLRLKWNAQG